MFNNNNNNGTTKAVSNGVFDFGSESNIKTQFVFDGLTKVVVPAIAGFSSLFMAATNAKTLEKSYNRLFGNK